MKVKARDLLVGDTFAGCTVVSASHPISTRETVVVVQYASTDFNSELYVPSALEIDIVRPVKTVTVTIELTEADARLATGWTDNLTPIYTAIGVACRKALEA